MMSNIWIWIVVLLLILILNSSSSKSAASGSTDNVVSLQNTGANGSSNSLRAIYTFDPTEGNVFLIDTALLTPTDQKVYLQIETANTAAQVPGKTIKFLINAKGANDNLVDLIFGSSLGLNVDVRQYATSAFDLFVLPIVVISDGTQFQLLSNAGGWNTPCFLGEGLVSMQDGSFKRVDELRKGDKVLGGTIKCMIKTDTPFGTDIVRLGEMAGGWTPHHPVRVNNKVYLPHELGVTKHEDCDAVYNFIMEDGDTMFVGGIETYAIGCDQTDFPVKSSFFAKREKGVRNIMDYYDTLEEFEQGYIHTKHENPMTLEHFKEMKESAHTSVVQHI